MAAAQRRTKAIIFDLDGTLIDSAPDIAAAVNLFLAEHGWGPVATADVEKFVGDGPRSLLLRILDEQGLPTDDAFVAEAHAAYLANYARAPATHTRLFAHVPEDLASLRSVGFRLGICTNKPNALTQRVLAALGIDTLFAAAIGADAVPRRKPHADHLLAVIDAMGVARDEVVYVGDTDVDRACAANADVPFFVVSWGRGMLVPDTGATRIGRLADLGRHLPEPVERQTP